MLLLIRLPSATCAHHVIREKQATAERCLFSTADLEGQVNVDDNHIIRLIFNSAAQTRAAAQRSERPDISKAESTRRKLYTKYNILSGDPIFTNCLEILQRVVGVSFKYQHARRESLFLDKKPL